MSAIGSMHEFLASHAGDFRIDVLAGSDVQERIQTALDGRLGNRRLRACPLRPMLVFWLALALPLFRSDSIVNVFSVLLMGWRRKFPHIDARAVSGGALAHARERLGAAPLKAFFEDVASDVDPEASFHGRSVLALDCTMLTVPDTSANAQRFGRHHAGNGPAAFPQMRVAILYATRTHEIRAAAWGPCTRSEREVAREPLKAVRKGEIVILDRGFAGVELLDRLGKQGVFYLVRMLGSARPHRMTRRGPGDYDVVLRSSRAQDTHEGRRLCVRTRMIEYRIGQNETVRLVTNMTDPAIEALELAQLYHERWEVELGHDEIKTHLSSVRHGTLHTPFRGKDPDLVEQEFWATLALYNLVRRLILRAAELHRIDARQISFVDALVVIRAYAQGIEQVEGERRVRLYVRLITDLGACAMGAWRRPRVCPRAIRIKTSSYRHKKPGERCEHLDPPPQLRLGSAA